MNQFDNRRNRAARLICNIILNTLATKDYRDTLDRLIRVGMGTIDQERQRSQAP